MVVKSILRPICYGAVPVRCGVAMTITVAILVSLIIGLAFGSVIAGIAMMERRSTRHWVVYLRLPEDLHRRLSEAATDHRWSLRAEIINRLEASFGPTKSYEF